MLLLSREDIKKVFSIQDAIEADKKAFTLVADKKCDSPLRTNIQAPKYDGCFLFMPAYIEEMDTAILPRASKIYFDSQEAVLSESGDILLPLEEGIITEEDFTGNIGDVIKGNFWIHLRTVAYVAAVLTLHPYHPTGKHTDLLPQDNNRSIRIHPHPWLCSTGLRSLVSRNLSFSSTFSASGYLDKNKAAAPETTGVAIDVPLFLIYGFLFIG